MKKDWPTASVFLLIPLLFILNSFYLAMDSHHALNGRWVLTRAVSAGEEGASPKGTFLVIQGDEFERHTPTYVFNRKIKINDAVVPHQIDLLITNEPDKGQTFLGIYKIEGNTLMLAHALPSNPRPTDFESTQENKQILSISVKQQ